MIAALVKWWRGRGNGKGSQRSDRYCPAGHPMDPNWETCPRCAAEQRAREKTRLENPADVINAKSQGSTTMARSPTVISDGEQEPRLPPEKIARPPELQPAPSQKAHTRKITGVLVTFTWQPQGQLFALYEGRNVIGSGTVESEGGRECDIQITNDRTLSNEHAVILCRNGRYDLIDRFSANGTYLNDQFVESQGAKLPDGATIRTGATVWAFRSIEDNRQGAAEAPTTPPSNPPPTTPGPFNPG
jgi:hypothetical protein